MLYRSTLQVFFIVAGILHPGCASRDSKKDIPVQKDFILEERDLLPEGIAFDRMTGAVFISSTYKRKIVRIDSAGHFSDFIKEKQNGIWSTLGMEVDAGRRRLWAVSCQATEVTPMIDPDSLQWRSAVYQFDIDTGILVDSCLLAAKNSFLNDLTVAQNGDVYITETVQHRIYRLKAGSDSLQLFLSPKPYTFLNGISFSDQPGQLFVSGTEGILKIDMTSHQYKILKAANTVNAKEIDGLTFYKNSFIGHQSSKVVRFFLNEQQDSITSSAIVNSGAEFDSSTTGETDDNNYYFIVNSQIQSGIYFKKQALKPMDSLEKVIIRRISL